MTISLTFTIIGFSISLITTLVIISMYIQKLRSDVNATKDYACTEIKHLYIKLEDYKEVNSGIFKEIKDELKELKNLMLEIIKNERRS